MTKNQFNRLSKFKKRISVAKDVLLQLKLKKFVPSPGTYLEMRVDYEYDDSAQKVIQAAPECEVCAKGALVCSYILNYNNATMDQVDDGIEDYPEMVEIFGESLWNIIEALFEGWKFDKDGESCHSYWEVDDEAMFPYNQNGKTYSLESIMKNIIRNGGKYNYNGIIFE